MSTDVVVLCLVVIFGMLFMLSENRSMVSGRVIAVGFSMQLLFAAIVLSSESLRGLFTFIGRGVVCIQAGALKGAQFVFGYLGGGDMPFDVKGNTFIFLFQALPTILVIGSLSMLLFYWGIIQRVVSALAYVFRKTLDVRGALALCAGAKMFLGQTDAPLLVRPYLPYMTRSEMCAVMSMGMSTTSVTVLALYAMILQNTIPDVMMHLITSTVMSVPTALAFARIMVPADKQEKDIKDAVPPKQAGSVMEAITIGMYQAKDVIVGISISLIVFIAFMFIINQILATVFPGWTLERIMGYVMSPLAFLLGFTKDRALDAGSVLGLKVVFNEIFAFDALSKLKHFSEHDRIVLFYASNGFTNVSSVGIVVSAWHTFAPKARQFIPRLAMKALFIGLMVSLANAAVVRFILDIHETIKAL